MKRITTFFYLIFITATFNSCNLIPPSPNEPFYCKINGKKFRPGKDTSPIGGLGSSNLKVDYNSTEGWFYISSRNLNEYISFSIKIKSNEEISAREITFSTDTNDVNAFYSNNAYDDKPKYMKAYIGKLIISKVTNKGYYGTFEFNTKDATGKEFKITNGQFNALR